MKEMVENHPHKQQIIAEEMGISQPHLSDILNGKSSRRIAEIKKFAKILGKEEEEILTGKEMVQNNENKDSSKPINIQYINTLVYKSGDVEVEKLIEEFKKALEGLGK